jgi:hypothetical protein
MSQRTVLYLEPKRRGTTLGCVFMALVCAAVATAAVLYEPSWLPQQPPPPEGIETAAPIVAGVAALLVVVFLIGALVNGRRWMTARRVEKLSKNPRFGQLIPDTEVAPPTSRVNVVPPLQIDIVKGQKLPKPKVRVREVTPDANVIGRRPLHIAFLRVFENQPRMRTFIEGAWREFGWVYFLRSAAAVTPAELKAAKQSGNLAAMFASSDEPLLAQVDGPPLVTKPKGRYRFTRIAATKIKVRDRYGNYPIRAVLCHGSYWKRAVDLILERVDLVVLDLSGYRPKNEGTRYELQRVIDRFPLDQVVFLADERSKRKILLQEVSTAWNNMAATSPNAFAPGRAVIVRTDYFRGTQQQGQAGQAAQVRVRLVARRSQTRRVAAMAQERCDAARARMRRATASPLG